MNCIIALLLITMCFSCSKKEVQPIGSSDIANHEKNLCIVNGDTLNSIIISSSQSFLYSTWVLKSIVDLDDCSIHKVQKEDWWIHDINLTFYKDSVIDNTYNLHGTTINNNFLGNYTLISPNQITIEIKSRTDLADEPLDTTFYEILEKAPIHFYNTDTTLYLLNSNNEVLIFKL